MSLDISRVEAVLREIATDLVNVPLDEHGRALHLRALALKRIVSAWAGSPPSDADRDAALDALESLRLEVLDLRAVTSEVRLRSPGAGSSRAAKTRR